jgi:hypothetical protein
VEEQRWLVNGDRSPLAGIGLPPGSETIHGPEKAKAEIEPSKVQPRLAGLNWKSKDTTPATVAAGKRGREW